MNVNLFGSFWNAQLPRYISLWPQLEAMAVNAFSINWGDFIGYMFPLFSMIPKCLEMIRREEANVGMICPVWSAQPWYPVLLEMVGRHRGFCIRPTVSWCRLKAKRILYRFPAHFNWPLGNCPAEFQKKRLFEPFGRLSRGWKPRINYFDLRADMENLGELEFSTGWRSLVNHSDIHPRILGLVTWGREIV